MSVAVEPGSRRRGGGTTLLDDALRAAGTAGATRVHTQALDAERAGAAFAERHGFTSIARILLRVDLSGAPHGPDLARGPRSRLRESGDDVRCRAFYAHAEADGRLYEINRTAGLDDPGAPPARFRTSTAGARSCSGRPGFQPEGQFVAVSEGRYVGLAAAGHDEGDATADALIAGVEPAFRGRGMCRR